MLVLALSKLYNRDISRTKSSTDIMNKRQEIILCVASNENPSISKSKASLRSSSYLTRGKSVKHTSLSDGEKMLTWFWWIRLNFTAK